MRSIHNSASMHSRQKYRKAAAPLRVTRGPRARVQFTGAINGPHGCCLCVLQFNSITISCAAPSVLVDLFVVRGHVAIRRRRCCCCCVLRGHLFTKRACARACHIPWGEIHTKLFWHARGLIVRTEHRAFGACSTRG